MSFCPGCGKEIQIGVKFCAGCGLPVGANSCEKRQVYVGRIHKCPNCGQVLESFSGNCPLCGYELRNIGTSDSVSKFAQRIDQILAGRTGGDGKVTDKTDEQLVALISIFPVPNTKEDLLEFVILASSNIDTAPRKAISKAWINKLEQVYNKSLLIYDVEDVRFKKIQSIYEGVQSKLQRRKADENRKNKISSLLAMSGSVIAVVLLLLGTVLGLKGDSSMDSSRANFIQLIAFIILIVSTIFACRRDSAPTAPVAAVGASIISLVTGVLIPIISDDSMDSSRSAMTITVSAVALIISGIGLLKFSKTNKNK